MEINNFEIKTGKYEYVEIYNQLKSKYGDKISKEVKGVNIIHKDGNVFVEVITESEFNDLNMSPQFVIELSTLNFIFDNEMMLFNALNSVIINANTFLEMDDQSTLIAASKIFTKEAEKEILDQF